LLMQTLPRSSLADQAYAVLLDAIVRGELAPGARLRDQDIAGTLGTSRTPVREALRRLVDEGLVETAPNAATRVTAIDVDTVAEAFPVVAALQALATRLGVPGLTGADDERMAAADAARAQALAAGDVLAAIDADDDFHGVLVQAARNHELDRTLTRLMPKIRRMDFVHFGELARSGARGNHPAILDACRRRAAEEAADLVEANFLSLGEQVAALLTAQAARR